MGIRIVNSSKNQSKKHRFKLWVAVFFLLLSLVVLFAYLELFTLAKVSGVSLVVLLSIILRWWLHVSKLNAVSNPPTPLNANDWFELHKHYPFLRDIDKDKKEQLIAQIGLLLSNVIFLDLKGETHNRFEAIQISLYIVVKYWLEDIVFENAIFVHEELIFELNDDNMEFWSIHPNLVHFMNGFNRSTWLDFLSNIKETSLISKKV